MKFNRDEQGKPQKIDASQKWRSPYKTRFILLLILIINIFTSAERLMEMARESFAATQCKVETSKHSRSSNLRQRRSLSEGLSLQKCHKIHLQLFQLVLMTKTPYLSMVEKWKSDPISRSVSKSNWMFLIRRPTSPKYFMNIHQQLSE